MLKVKNPLHKALKTVNITLAQADINSLALLWDILTYPLAAVLANWHVAIRHELYHANENLTMTERVQLLANRMRNAGVEVSTGVETLYFVCKDGTFEGTLMLHPKGDTLHVQLTFDRATTGTKFWFYESLKNFAADKPNSYMELILTRSEENT